MALRACKASTRRAALTTMKRQRAASSARAAPVAAAAAGAPATPLGLELNSAKAGDAALTPVWPVLRADVEALKDKLGAPSRTAGPRRAAAAS